MWIIPIGLFVVASALIFIGSLVEAIRRPEGKKRSKRGSFNPWIAAFLFVGSLGFFLVAWQTSRGLSAPTPEKDYAIMEHGATLYVSLNWYGLGQILKLVGLVGFILGLLFARREKSSGGSTEESQCK